MREARAARGETVRLSTLTSLRAVAAFLVFSRHTSEFLFHHSNSPLTRQAGAAVSFFFVLSGFVMAWSARPGDTAGRFYRRRFARIYPVYITVLVFAMGTEVVRHKVSALSFGLNAVLLQSWIPDAHVFFASDMGAWSLGCEAFFYLSFPLILPRLVSLSARRRWQVAGGAAMFELAMALISHSNNQVSGFGLWLVYIFPVTRISEFVIGIVLALAVKEGFRPGLSLARALLLALAAYVLAGFVPFYLLYEVVTLVPFALLVAAAAATDIAGEQTIWRSRRLVRLGDWSYAFYLVHITIVTVVAHLVGPRAGLAEQIGAAAAALLVATVAAGFVHTYIETPAERRLRGSARLPAANTAPPAGSPAVDAEVLGDRSTDGQGPHATPNSTHSSWRRPAVRFGLRRS